MTSFSPPTADSLADVTSTFQPCVSAYRMYMRNNSAANSEASSPPVPLRISSTTFFSSFGSFGSSRILSSSSMLLQLRLETLDVVRAPSAARSGSDSS